jgi:hypothetical protein
MLAKDKPFFKTLNFSNKPTDMTRLIIGLLLGLIFMGMIVSVFIVNSFDFDNMRRGTMTLYSGINPWAPETRVIHFYNPPFAILYFWFLLITSPKILLVLGGACFFALIFYYKAWVALAWFLTNTFLWITAAGGIDMLVIGLGLLLLLASDQVSNRKLSTALRVIAYGLLLIKPQGGFFIVFFYVLKRRDWVGVGVSILVFGLLFAPLYPSWLHVIRTDPPLAQTEASHSLYAKFGLVFSLIVAIAVIFARRWKYWQLGGALAGILAPYGMPGVPIFLVLTSVDRLAAIPAIIIYSAGLTWLTWVAPQSPLMGIYHLGMLGIALVLACVLPSNAPLDANDVHLQLKLGAISRWYKAIRKQPQD